MRSKIIIIKKIIIFFKVCELISNSYKRPNKCDSECVKIFNEANISYSNNNKEH